MKRIADDNLAQWYASPHRKPLVIRGARQVGKTMLVRLFAEQRRLTLHEVNLERHPQLSTVFAQHDSRRLLSELEFLIGRGPIRAESALLFLDEIQAIPEAIPALRYLQEDMPELCIVAAGSLLEFVLADHAFPMPVGRVEYLFLEPMSFEEFLEAADEVSLLNLLRTFNWTETFPDSAHDRLLECLREYLLVGGMPEAVIRYLEAREFTAASVVHASILETYRDDFAKYATRTELRRLQKIYDFIPGAVGDKFKYVRVDKTEQSRDIKRALELLVMARVVRRVTHSDGTGIPLGATLKPAVFKTYFLDVGLLNTACGLDRLSPTDLTDARFVNEGPMAEQFVAQHLPLLSPNDRRFVPTYWLREGRANNAEIDFLVQLAAEVVPLEVKAGKSGTMKSLLEFVHRRQLARAVRLDTNKPDLQFVAHARARSEKGAKTEFTLMSLPLYLIEQLPRLAIEAEPGRTR